MLRYRAGISWLDFMARRGSFVSAAPSAAACSGGGIVSVRVLSAVEAKSRATVPLLSDTSPHVTIQSGVPSMVTLRRSASPGSSRVGIFPLETSATALNTRPSTTKRYPKVPRIRRPSSCSAASPPISPLTNTTEPASTVTSPMQFRLMVQARSFTVRSTPTAALPAVFPSAVRVMFSSASSVTPSTVTGASGAPFSDSLVLKVEAVPVCRLTGPATCTVSIWPQSAASAYFTRNALLFAVVMVRPFRTTIAPGYVTVTRLLVEVPVTTWVRSAASR